MTLNDIEVMKVVFNLYESYITQCKQRVIIGSTRSNFVISTCGVLQGTILCTLLLLLYINNIKNSLSVGKLILFAQIHPRKQ